MVITKKAHDFGISASLLYTAEGAEEHQQDDMTDHFGIKSRRDLWNINFDMAENVYYGEITQMSIISENRLWTSVISTGVPKMNVWH